MAAIAYSCVLDRVASAELLIHFADGYGVKSNVKRLLVSGLVERCAVGLAV